MDDDELLQALADELEDETDAEQEPLVQMQLVMRRGETVAKAKARAALTSEWHAAHSIFQLNRITPFKEADLTELANHLDHQTKQLKDGDLGQAESMLVAQAYTLDALFHNLLTRSAQNMKNAFSVVEGLLRIALKAQSQCRTTLDSLASMKKPPPEIIKQTNIAHGHQQVNNFPEKQNPPNELLEKTDGERLDFGKAATPIRGDTTLETVGKKHRTKDT